MPDAVIRADAVQNAPAGYTVPGAQEILVKSVRAVVDGSGAGAAFDAVLQLIDPAGNVCWQSPTDTTIAAGASADVSWFPRVGGGSGSSTVVNNSQTAYVWGVAAAMPAVPSGSGGTPMQWQHFQTTDSSIFGTDTGLGKVPPYHNTTGDSFLYFNKNGAYVCNMALELPSGAYNQAVFLDNPGSQFALDINSGNAAPTEVLATNVAVDNSFGDINEQSRRMFYVDTGDTPGIVRVLIDQQSGVNKTVLRFNMGIMYLGGTVSQLTQVY